MLFVSFLYYILKLEYVKFPFFVCTTKDIVPGYYKDEINWPKMFILLSVTKNFYSNSPFNVISYF